MPHPEARAVGGQADDDGAYTVTADLWWGTNATSYRFLERRRGRRRRLRRRARAQKATLAVNGKTNGSYTYTVEFTNAAGRP